MREHWLIKPEVARKQLGITPQMMNKLKPYFLMVITPHNSRFYVRAYHEELQYFLNGRPALTRLVRTFAASVTASQVTHQQKDYFNHLVASKARDSRLSTPAICEIMGVDNNTISEWVQSGKLTPQRESGRGNPQTYSVEEFVRSCHVVGPDKH